MSYADGLLSTGERIVHRKKQHPFVFIWGARWTILAVVIAVVLFWLGGNLDPDGISGSLRQLLGWITAGPLRRRPRRCSVWTALRYINQEYVLTNRRVIQVEGVAQQAAPPTARSRRSTTRS